MTIDEVLREVWDALGPGWPEVIYQKAIEVELRRRGVPFETQRAIPVRYGGYVIGVCVPDLVLHLGGHVLVVEVKAVDYLKAGDLNQLTRYVSELSEQESVPVGGMLANFSQGGSRQRIPDLGDGLQVLDVETAGVGPAVSVSFGLPASEQKEPPRGQGHRARSGSFLPPEE